MSSLCPHLNRIDVGLLRQLRNRLERERKSQLDCSGCWGVLSNKLQPNGKSKGGKKGQKARKKRAQQLALQRRRLAQERDGAGGGAERDRIWLCLQCANAGCGRTSEAQHALEHFKRLPKHSLCLSWDEGFQVWCYACDDEVCVDVYLPPDEREVAAVTQPGVGKQEATQDSNGETEVTQVTNTRGVLDTSVPEREIGPSPAERSGADSVQAGDGAVGKGDAEESGAVVSAGDTSSVSVSEEADSVQVRELAVGNGEVEESGDIVIEGGNYSTSLTDEPAVVSVGQGFANDGKDGKIEESGAASQVDTATTSQLVEVASGGEVQDPPKDIGNEVFMGGLFERDAPVTANKDGSDMSAKQTPSVYPDGGAVTAKITPKMQADAKRLSDCIDFLRKAFDGDWQEGSRGSSTTGNANWFEVSAGGGEGWQEGGGKRNRKNRGGGGGGGGGGGRRQKLTLNQLKQDSTPEFSAESTHKLSAVSPAGARGLRNLGNTCFFNSICQCLVQCASLRKYFADHPLSSEEKSRELTRALAGFVREMWLDDEKHRSFNTFNPRSLFLSLCQKAPRFYGWQQQDSHELFVFLLDVVDEEAKLAQREAGKAEGSGGDAANAETPMVWNAVKDIFEGKTRSTVTCEVCGDTSSVSEVFNHLSLSIDLVDQRTKMKTNSGSARLSYNERLQKEIELLEEQKGSGRKMSKRNSRKLNRLRQQLELSRGAQASESSSSSSEGDAAAIAESFDSKTLSVENCLRYFTALERLDKHNKVICMECTKRKAGVSPAVDGGDAHLREGGGEEGEADLVFSRATKQLCLQREDLPPVLVVHLKRFMQTTMGLRKDDTFVEFSEYLDVTPFVGSSSTGKDDRDACSLRYRLCGLSVHGGSMSGGHYVAYVRKNAGGPSAVEGQAPASWYFMSDSHVTETSLHTVLQQQAYVLFYERI